MKPGEKIKELRENKKMTLSELSKKSGVSVGYLSEIERGKYNIAVDKLEKICAALEITLSDFFKDDDSILSNSEVMEIYQTMLKNDELRIFFKKAKKLSVEDLKTILPIIDLIDKENR